MRHLHRLYPEDCIECRFLCNIIGTTAALIGGLVASTGGGIASSVIGSNASKSAADKQVNAAKYAADLQNNQFQQTRADQAPWLQAGQVSLNRLMQGLAPGSDEGLATPYGGTFNPPPAFKAPTLAEAQATPGYQFAQQAGDIGIEHAASAAGGAFTTGTLGQEAQFNQGLAQNAYQQTYNNALSANQNAYGQALNSFQTQYNAYNTNQANLYNRLASLSGLGQTSAAQLGQIGEGTAANIGNTITGGGAAGAAGSIGSASAITGGINSSINGMNNGLGNYLSLQALMKSNASGLGGYSQNDAGMAL